ncbi:hypothetical protein Tco_1382969 [Tanacetum coccineum]
MDFLTRSSIHFPLTISPVGSTSFVEQLWKSAKSRTINNISYIDAIVAGKPMTISEASIRSDLLFNDADGIDTLNNQAIFDTIYSKSTFWDQIPTNIATAVICLTTDQKYNFSKLIFDGMMRHLDATKKFVMYPRFLQIFLRNQLKDVPVPMDHFPVPTLTKKPDLSPRPSPSIPIPDSNPEGSGGNHGGQSSSDRSLSGTEDGLTLQGIKQLKKKAKPIINHHKAWFRAARLKKQQKNRRSVSKQMKKAVKSSKGAPYVHTHTDWNDMYTDLEATLNDAMDYTLTQDEGKTKQQSTVKPDEGTEKQNEGTDRTKVSTDSFVEGTAKLKDQVSGESDTSTVPIMTSTPTLTVFGDDETIAQVLVTMSQNKLKQKKKKKGVELKNVEDIERPRPTSIRSLLTLKHLPKIDPKAKGKGKIKEEDESDTESEDITEAKKKFKMLANDEEMAKKVQEEWEAEEEKKRLAEEEATKTAFTNKYDFIQARLNADKILVEKLQEEER